MTHKFKLKLTGKIVIGVIFASIPAIRAIAKDAEQTRVKPEQLVGAWYMGTMTGFDCNMSINSNGTLSVQFGGCFHTDAPITVRWKIQEDRINLQGAGLEKSLGSSLQVVTYNGHLVLIPERPQPNAGKHKYSYYHCFWRNMLKDGLELPKDAPQ